MFLIFFSILYLHFKLLWIFSVSLALIMVMPKYLDTGSTVWPGRLLQSKSSCKFRLLSWASSSIWLGVVFIYFTAHHQDLCILCNWLLCLDCSCCKWKIFENKFEVKSPPKSEWSKSSSEDCGKHRFCTIVVIMCRLNTKDKIQLHTGHMTLWL